MAKNQSIAVFTCVSTCSIAVGALFALFLSACGGDSSSSGPSDNVSLESDIIKETFDELPVCTDKREGATAYVKEEKTAYVCIDGDWVVDGDEISSSSRHCEDCKDEAISSSSIDKEISSSNDKEEKSSSSEASSSSTLTNEQNSSTSEQPDIAAIKDKSISGVSQKGPFVTGSTVKLYELDGKNYAFTGKSFAGKITTDDGKFSISNVTLAGPYVLLEANGYFRNEVTGSKSKGPVSLNVLTDLSDRKTVNINLLTHLEYERVLYLMSTGIKSSSAKKQAETEILSAFGIKGEFASFEDLDIFSKGDGGAVLLAINVLMLQNLSEADLTELLNDFAINIESDGRWDDEVAKAKIADWAAAKDLAGGLDSIRRNIEKWDMGTVPEFEKYVRNYWYANYGLGECGSSNKAEVLSAKNERSAKYGTQVRYICKDGAWLEATDIEKDTYKWETGKDGEIKTGDVTLTKKYDYDGKLKMWRDATAVEAVLGGCTEALEKDFSLNTGKVNGTWYICKNREWESTNNITVDTQGWIKGSDGDLQKGDSTDAIYKYDDAQKKWLMATNNDTTLKLMGCTTNRTGEMGKSSADDTYYVCKNMDWQKAQEIDYDTYGEKCTSKEVGKMIDGVVTASNKYYCTANGWVSLMGGWNWEVPKEARLNPEITYGTMTDSRDKKVYKTVKIGDQVWMAENLNYADSIATPSLKGKSWCYDNKIENCAVAGRLYTWAAAIDSVALFDDGNGVDCGYGKGCWFSASVNGICPSGWHLPFLTEWITLLGEVGESSIAGKMLKSLTGWYNSGNGTDGVGFSALPAGSTNFYGNFSDGGYGAYFWSASGDLNGVDAYAYGLDYINGKVESLTKPKYLGFSVRCVKD